MDYEAQNTQDVQDTHDEVGDDIDYMRLAFETAAPMTGLTSPNPWVGAVLVTKDGRVFKDATSPRHGAHAEAKVLAAAGAAATGATLYCTLEPCCHHGENPPCAQLIIDAKVARVIAAIQDPDPRVNGAGIQLMRNAGIEVEVGELVDKVEAQLAPYLKHRRSGLPYVILKMAATLDGRTSAADGSSKWITGAMARRDVANLRARSDAVVVGKNTLELDDPSLRVHLDGYPDDQQPMRVVVGEVPATARCQPALSWKGSLVDLLHNLADKGCLTVLVEGGATLAGEFHSQGLIDRYVIYVAPKFMGGDDGRPVFAGCGAPNIDSIVNGELLSVQVLDNDVRLDVRAIKN